MAAMDEASVDAIVCDPPYDLTTVSRNGSASTFVDNPYGRARIGTKEHSPLGGFMGKTWDGTGVAFKPETWEAALHILKPGGHLLAFGGTRTYHRMAVAIEDAGFEIRDTIAWMYGSGFPKSLDVSKAIDRAAGAEREDLGPSPRAAQQTAKIGTTALGDFAGEPRMTAPATSEARQWEGWGTALKPGHEPIVVARKPFTGTVARNVLTHGTGALNIDGCRLEPGEGGDRAGEATAAARYAANGSTNFAATPGPRGGSDAGRWPANVVMDEEAAAMLDEQTGTLKSGAHSTDHQRTAPKMGHGGVYGDHAPDTAFTVDREANEGGASRFFYVAKPDADERQAGLGATAGLFSPMDAPDRNDHPTVKPIALMRWLVRLVTPPGGTVLDPFTGSGTTGCAAALEGFNFIGIEREDAYVAIARARLAHWSSGAMAA